MRHHNELFSVALTNLLTRSVIEGCSCKYGTLYFGAVGPTARSSLEIEQVFRDITLWLKKTCVPKFWKLEGTSFRWSPYKQYDALWLTVPILRVPKVPIENWFPGKSSYDLHELSEQNFTRLLTEQWIIILIRLESLLVYVYVLG